MKTYLMVWLALLGWSALSAQTEPIKVVFDLSSGDENTQGSALRHLKLMSESYPDSEFELVVYSKALSMVLKEGSPFVEKIQEFQGNDKISIKVCEVTMKRREISKDQLVVGVESVPDAIMEIVTKQKEGWGYIKEAN